MSCAAKSQTHRSHNGNITQWHQVTVCIVLHCALFWQGANGATGILSPILAHYTAPCHPNYFELSHSLHWSFRLLEQKKERAKREWKRWWDAAWRVLPLPVDATTGNKQVSRCINCLVQSQTPHTIAWSALTTFMKQINYDQDLSLAKKNGLALPEWHLRVFWRCALMARLCVHMCHSGRQYIAIFQWWLHLVWHSTRLLH